MFSVGMDGMTYILKGYVRKGVENKMNNNSNKLVASPYLNLCTFSFKYLVWVNKGNKFKGATEVCNLRYSSTETELALP